MTIKPLTDKQLTAQILAAFNVMDAPDVTPEQEMRATEELDNIIDAFGLDRYERLADALPAQYI